MGTALVHPFTVSYEWISPLIQELLEFRKTMPIKVDLAKRDQRRWCSYHKGQMSHSHEALENLNCILSKFNGATTISMGDALLPIEAELVTLCLRFSMVGYLTPYNAILG
ncbi:hypothetical protein CK203_059706 [Vitis vinifera]|uniref:Uncharacterized protein n=1 Tax=Vitis vinifera TaxID=29760 RepID=A0A438GFN5_VITVI|nr:hypothetical protein CK203_059706 [Vitis vinifera]